MKRKTKMKGVLSCLLALVLALSITPSVFAEETVGSTTNNVDAINGDDTQEGVGTTTDKAYKTEETVGGTTNNVNAINGDDTPETIYVDAINGDDTKEGVGTTAEKAYKSIGKAVKAAQSGDTIKLAKGLYSLYEVCGGGPKGGPDNTEYTKNKDLTFIGAGPEETKWGIGAKVPDPDKFGTEYNSDYSFDGRGTKEKKETVTFKNMTLQAASEDYLGFAGTDKTIVENCVINGKTFYLGYTSATFKYTTFNCPNGDYAIWTYSSPVMTFDNCTFNSTGKVINVYTDAGAGSHDITVNFNSCTVNNSGLSFPFPKPVLNINDSNMGKFKYIINISGNNVVNGVATDKTTCSRLFGYGGKPANNTGSTIVKFGNTTVWQDKGMVDAKAYHNSGVTANGVTYTNDVKGSNDSLYAEGYKDHALVTTYGEWITNEDGKITRDVTKKCTYCGYEEKVKEYQVKLTYDANGGKGAIDSATGAAGENVTVAENVFTRNNYTFTGWNTQADGKGTAYKAGDSFTLTDKDTVLYAQWSKNAPAQVKVSYDANGGTGTMESITGDVGSKIVIEQNGFARSGYTFTGWNTQADGKGTAYKAGNSFTLTDKDTVLYAQWSKNSGSAGTGTKGIAKPSAGTGTKGTAKPTDSPKTGDNSNLALWFALLFVSGGAVIATTIYGRKNKRSVK
ncbi:InlB B-repeat-containing protein [Coprococcus comes]|uniref:InlB B-repeat-containing protein n=1 Tax=Coprococcus comes TaxID=410072 RepID=UPI00156EB1EE|nr:InlB B-repeat-containing protein [Coprococcus comes]NSE79871.1 InlB B-repeat-containing protein [Coprococcus comes]NSE82652.1 InlB B-repeat-containing protein [Coprococcus comes]NSF20628.1 InlB B-repeat-containing protein [Coprococcus comes]